MTEIERGIGARAFWSPQWMMVVLQIVTLQS